MGREVIPRIPRPAPAAASGPHSHLILGRPSVSLGELLVERLDLTEDQVTDAAEPGLGREHEQGLLTPQHTHLHTVSSRFMRFKLSGSSLTLASCSAEAPSTWEAHINIQNINQKLQI